LPAGSVYSPRGSLRRLSWLPFLLSLFLFHLEAERQLARTVVINGRNNNHWWITNISTICLGLVFVTFREPFGVTLSNMEIFENWQYMWTAFLTIFPENVYIYF
jgi:hypothetical protein